MCVHMCVCACVLCASMCVHVCACMTPCHCSRGLMHPSWRTEDTSLGALGDSFYEYLLKVWVYAGRRTLNSQAGREAFDAAMAVSCLSHRCNRMREYTLLSKYEGEQPQWIPCFLCCPCNTLIYMTALPSSSSHQLAPLQTVQEKLMFKSKKSDLLYIAEWKGTAPVHKMGHLVRWCV